MLCHKDSLLEGAVFGLLAIIAGVYANGSSDAESRSVVSIYALICVCLVCRSVSVFLLGIAGMIVQPSLQAPT